MLDLKELNIIKANLPETDATKKVIAKVGYLIELNEAQNKYTSKVTEIKNNIAELYI